MMSIRELLNRIRWDPNFGDGAFEIGYHDRVEDAVLWVPFDEMNIERGNTFSFSVTDAFGSTCSIPFHRVREVKKDGEVIWRRPEAD